MIHIVLFFVLLGLLGGKLSVRGRRLYFSAHPLVVRMRYAGAGVLAGTWLARGELVDTDRVAWLGLAMLTVSAARQLTATARAATPPTPQPIRVA